MRHYRISMMTTPRSKRQVFHQILTPRLQLLRHHTQSKMDPSLHCHKEEKTIFLTVVTNAIRSRKLTLHHRRLMACRPALSSFLHRPRCK